MELRYLQIYRLISNFATSLVGAFIPLILFEYTGNIIYSVLYIVLQRLMSAILNKLFEKAVFKKPQVFLMFRVIPIIIFEVLTIFVDKSPILISGLIGVAYAFDYACNILPSEMVFNYNSTDDSAKTLGITRTIEQIGFVLAMVLGSLFLDNLPVYYLIIMSISLYIISIIPLTIFYVKNKQRSTYNKEFVSSAIESNTHDKAEKQKIIKSVKKKYFIQYLFIQGTDVFYLLLPFVVYLSYGKFVQAAIMTAVYDTVLCVVGVLIGKLDEKKDLTKLNSICCFLSGILIVLFMILLPYTELFYLECVLVFIISVTTAFPYIFVYNRMLSKARVLGTSSQSISNMLLACALSDVVVQSFGFFFPMAVPMYLGAGLLVAEAVVCPILEESSRKDMVDFIGDNETATNLPQDVEIVDISNYKDKL